MASVLIVKLAVDLAAQDCMTVCDWQSRQLIGGSSSSSLTGGSGHFTLPRIASGIGAVLSIAVSSAVRIFDQCHR